MPIDEPFIQSVLERFEGKGVRKAYIPKSKGVILGQSGVTVGTGVDLGQQSESGLLAMGVPRPLVEKLRPYLGKKKEEADALLKKYPLELTVEEVEQLDAAVRSSYIAATEKRFNGKKPATPFADCPKEVQAVAVSLEYQLGPGGAKKYTDLLAAGKYREAANLLRSAAEYQDRRRQEAALLDQCRA